MSHKGRPKQWKSLTGAWRRLSASERATITNQLNAARAAKVADRQTRRARAIKV